MPTPIYVIIGHGSDDAYTVSRDDLPQDPLQRDPLQRDPLRTRTFTMPDGAYYVACTPTSTWGLLSGTEDGERERAGHVMRLPAATIRSVLFAPPTGRRRVVIDSPEGGRTPGTAAQLCPAGGALHDTSFDFFGETLCGGGVGVLALSGARTAEATAAEGSTCVAMTPLYSSMRARPALWRLVAGRVRERRAVWLSELIETLGPGVYISLACRVLRVYHRREGWGPSRCLPVVPATQAVYQAMARENAVAAAATTAEWEKHMGRRRGSRAGPQQQQQQQPLRASCAFRGDPLAPSARLIDQEFSLADPSYGRITRARPARQGPGLRAYSTSERPG